jgi:hypothetical protein
LSCAITEEIDNLLTIAFVLVLVLIDFPHLRVSLSDLFGMTRAAAFQREREARYGKTVPRVTAVRRVS